MDSTLNESGMERSLANLDESEIAAAFTTCMLCIIDEINVCDVRNQGSEYLDGPDTLLPAFLQYERAYRLYTWLMHFVSKQNLDAALSEIADRYPSTGPSLAAYVTQDYCTTSQMLSR